MRPSHEGSGDTGARFRHWLERFYEENIDLVCAREIGKLSEEPAQEHLTRMSLSVLRKTEEQFSEALIEQFLSALEDEWRYGPVQQFCGEIVECQRLWRLLKEGSS